MNHRRYNSNLSIPTLIVLLVVVVIVSVGGVSYVMVKNKQVTMLREIAKTQQRMVEHNLAITMHQSDIERELDVFALREKLYKRGSDLQSIPTGLPEVYRPNQEVLARR